MTIKKILVPVVFREASLHVLPQAAYLARRFQAEVILLHVVAPLSYPLGALESGHEITAKDLHAEIVRRAQEDLNQTTGPEFDGIAVRRILLRGHAAGEIVQMARDENVDLIVMSSHGEGPFYRLLFRPVTAKVLHEIECPVWVGPHLEQAPAAEFAIRNILCAVDLNPHCRHSLALAAQLTNELGARMTLTNITGAVEAFGPGGSYVVPEWEETLVGYATKEIAKLQQSVGTSVDVIIESGNVPEQLNRVAEKTNADLMIIGRIPGRSHLGDNGDGYSIIRAAKIPVLSV